jgi:multidrug efflux pump subunit AcrB
VIAALLPMAFVSGLMGPYMSPIPINLSMGMAMSLAIAFVVTPWLALKLMKSHAGAHGAGEAVAAARQRSGRAAAAAFRRVLTPCSTAGGARWLLLAGHPRALLLSARYLPGAAGGAEDAALRQQERVPGGVDMPAGTPLEDTARRAARDGRAPGAGSPR